VENRNEIQQDARPDKIVTVLEVSPDQRDHASLNQIFRHSNWKIYSSESCSEAIQLLRKRTIPVVMCDCELPDGSWKDILDQATKSDNPPAIIVTSRLADDRLWAEVLSLGGYNVLPKPFKTDEVFREVGLAWLSWKSKQVAQRAARS
jgi:DNA-binding response OmpR family regulator